MTKPVQAFSFRVITILATIATLFSGSFTSIAIAQQAAAPSSGTLAQDPSPSPSADPSPSPSPSDVPSPTPSPAPSARMSVTANCANEYNNNVRANIRIVVTGGSVTVDQLQATLEGSSGGSVSYTPSNIVGRMLAPGTHDVQVLFRGYTLNSGTNDLRVRATGTLSGNSQTAFSPYFENCEVGASPSPSPSPTPSPSASPSPAPSDVPSPTPSPSASPSPAPSDVPSPSPAPSDVPSPTPSASPSPAPSDVPSPSPAPSDVPSPSASPSTPPTTGGTPPVQQPPVQELPAQQPPQTIGGVSEEAPAEPTRREAVAGASDEISEQPRALLPATGMSNTLTWLMLTLASLLIAFGAGLRAWRTRRF